jgi:hypothetical protein
MADAAPLDEFAMLDAEALDLEALTPEDFHPPPTNGTVSSWLLDNPAGRLPFVLDLAPENWYATYAMPVLAHFRTDPRQWGLILAKWGALYQKADLLIAAVDAWRREHPAPGQEASTPDEQLQRIYASSDPDVWYGALALLATLRRNTRAWSHAKAKAKQRGLDTHDLERAVDAMASAKARVPTTTEESQEPLPEAQQHSGVARLAEEWGIPIVGCVRHGLENTEWGLLLDTGQEIHLGSSKKILKEEEVRAAIFDVTGIAIKEYGRKERAVWYELIEIVAAVAVLVDTPELTTKGQARALLEGYLARNYVDLERDASDEEWAQIAGSTRAFVRQGLVHVHVQDIWLHYSRTMFPDVTTRMILEWLRLLGWHRVTVTRRGPPSTCRSMWAVEAASMVAFFAEGRAPDALVYEDAPHPAGAPSPSEDIDALLDREGF